eukprot:TRINITY_DN29601_c0_g1_i1.p1 TRINITY_DN29601_c0_g1~~TRINITY_DN29601_c0_g1_i1.p1  ORF type:complete len:738 (-),score=113.50 TRINITY_DN29601_c0_g1_i1:156-2369(-)
MASLWHGLLLALHLAQGAELSLNFNKDDGFAVLLDGQAWLQGGPVRVGSLASGGAGLRTAKRVSGQGHDELGHYETVTLVWADKDGNEVIHTSFRTYPQDAGMIVFEQYFPQDVHLPAGTLFPSFQSNVSGGARDLDCFAYHGIFPSLRRCKLSTYEATHQGGAPMVLYEASATGGPLAAMTVFSPLSFPKAQHMFSADGLVGAGIKSTVEVIPAGWQQLFLLSAGSGINDGMMAWGDRMLKFTGKPRADMYGDDVISTIGFWTDNGGYYHYATGTNESYEEVLPRVKDYHDSIGVPFRHWQFDSWFYPKDGAVSSGGGGGAVVNWTAMPSVFPSGMAYIQAKLGVPMVMHNRQWSPKSDYVKHEPYNWYKSEKAAVPEDPTAFFKYFFKQQEGWGLAMYEQDWMCTEYDQVEALQRNISMADDWLRGMALGAASSGRTVQYCMPYPYDLLSAAAYPAVTNARATGDYIDRETQWAIGATSMFYWAIGILPFKDGFYSSNLPQVGGQVVGPETQPDRAALMAALSGAMVGPMDGINLLNASRVMSSCRSDGVLLKPDKPVAPFESCFAAGVDPATCFDYITYSDISGLGRAFYVFMNSPGRVSFRDIMPMGATAKDYVVYNWYTESVSWLSSRTPSSEVELARGYEGHAYALAAPLVNGWALLGERRKLVPTASLRFPSVRYAGKLLEVSVRGAAGELVEVCVANSTGKVFCKSLRFAAAAVSTIEFESSDELALVV